MTPIQILNRAIKSVPYYQNKCKFYHHSIPWENIPVIDKNIVHSNWNLFQEKAPTTSLIYCRTSGSTGELLDIAWKPLDFYCSLTSVWHKRSQFGILPSDMYGTNHAYLFNKDRYPLNHKIIISKNCISFSKIDLSETCLMQYILYIKKYKLKWLLLQPTFAYYLGITKAKMSCDLSDLKLIELTGEKLLPNIQRKISCAFGVPVINHYGMQEFNSIAYSSDCEKLECFEDNCFIEVLDENNNNCGYGVEGDIVITTLSNTYMPLIRYKSKDRGILLLENGKKHLTITNARTKGVFNNHGKLYDASIFFWLTERINALGNKIYRFQYLYYGNELTCIFLSENILEIDSIKEFIIDTLQSNFEISFNCVNIDVDSKRFMEDTGSKIRYFVDCTPALQI